MDGLHTDSVALMEVHTDDTTEVRVARNSFLFSSLNGYRRYRCAALVFILSRRYVNVGVFCL